MPEASPKNLPPLACIVLAAGQGTRMKSDIPKVLHPVAGMPMIGHVLAALNELAPENITVVVGPDMAAVEKAVLPHGSAIQQKPLGTGDAVKAARKELESFRGDILVAFGDAPLVTTRTLQNLRLKRQEGNAAIAVGGFTTPEPAHYGRLLVDSRGFLMGIVEAEGATAEQRAITLCNSGIMLFAAEKLWPLLDKLRNDNAKFEYYLTSCIAQAVEDGERCVVADVPADEAVGINTRIELAAAERLMQKRLRDQAMLNGATLTDPDSVFLSADTRIGRDVTIGPNVVIGPGVEIGNRVTIGAFCHFEQAKIEDSAIVGPFARLRPGTKIAPGAHIGNFVELKNTEVGRGAKINHLSYIGDAFVGAKANIGAGTITCNYDGFRKHQTYIGAETFIGSNTALVAPVKVGDGAYVGAGSVITMEVPPNTLAVARGRQANIGDWAKRFREGESARNKDGK